MAVMDYRTRDGLADYGFWIEFQPNEGWRVYIIFEPSRQDHNGSLQLPYQSINGNGRRYVDWPEKLDNLGDARTVAALWAELAQNYQRAQEQNRFYVKLIEHYRRTQGQRRTTPDDRDDLDNPADVGRPGPQQQHHGPTIPRARDVK